MKDIQPHSDRRELAANQRKEEIVFFHFIKYEKNIFKKNNTILKKK